jgi:hypothetical protein
VTAVTMIVAPTIRRSMITEKHHSSMISDLHVSNVNQ